MQAAKGRLYGANLRAAACVGGQCRAVWNLFLGETAERYKAEGKFLFYAEMSARLPKLLKEDERLTGLPHRAAQMTVQRLDRALRDCAKSRGASRRGFPKFKRHADRDDAFSFASALVTGQAPPLSKSGKPRSTEALIELRPAAAGADPAEPRSVQRIRLPKIGWLRVRGMVLPEAASVRHVAVTQEPNGWHVSVQFEAAPKAYAVPAQPMVGIDVGLACLVTLSDGRKIAHPRIARKAQTRIRRLNRERDRRRKGSVNRRRTVARLARAHRHLADARRDHVHQITRALVDTYQGFAVEDLCLRGLMRTRMAGSLADAGLGGFLRVLRYKAEWAGRSWHVHERFQRSTGVCPDCAHVGAKLALSARRWACEKCGAAHDRDVAAARVILAGARTAQAVPVPQALREPAGAIQRKRGSAVRGGGRASARPSRGGSPSNVAAATGESRD